MKSKSNRILLASALFLLVAAPAYGQGFVFCGTSTTDPCTLSNLFELAFVLVNFLIGMAGLVALFFVVWGGMRMMLSGGNPNAITEGKSTVFNALLGLVVVFLSYLIVGYVAGLLLPGGSTGDPLKNLIDYVL